TSEPSPFDLPEYIIGQYPCTVTSYNHYEYRQLPRSLCQDIGLHHDGHEQYNPQYLTLDTILFFQRWIVFVCVFSFYAFCYSVLLKLRCLRSEEHTSELP